MPETALKEKLRLPILRNESLNAETNLLTLETPPETAERCLPGQFFNLRVFDATAPLLRRPVSVCDARPSKGEIDLLVRVVGRGTELLAARVPGSDVDAVGPLGTAFPVDGSRPALMIAGGVGVAPLHFLASWIRRQGFGIPVTFCYGARTQEDFTLIERLEGLVDHLTLATEDGSRGRRGYVTEAGAEHYAKAVQTFVCGPAPMMNAVLGQLRRQGLQGWLSLENQMGCGVGACQGCVVPGRDGMIRVCCDGPVVSSDKLDFVLGG